MLQLDKVQKKRQKTSLNNKTYDNVHSVDFFHGLFVNVKKTYGKTEALMVSEVMK